MKAVCIYFYLGRNICDFNKIFNRVHQFGVFCVLRAFYLCYIYTEDPLNPSLDPATRLYGR